ncbi:MAG: methyltransferase [Anaerolineales bacterium]
MGTGSGVGAVFAAQWAAKVVAVDVNPTAVRCARINALLNGVEDRVEVREGDLFTPVAGEKFDVVLFNPPYISGSAKNELEKAFFSTGVAGRFAEGLREHLLPGGYALLILSDIGGDFENDFLSALQQRGIKVKTLAKKEMVSETISIYQTEPRPIP